MSLHCKVVGLNSSCGNRWVGFVLGRFNYSSSTVAYNRMSANQEKNSLLFKSFKRLTIWMLKKYKTTQVSFFYINVESFDNQKNKFYSKTTLVLTEDYFCVSLKLSKFAMLLFVVRLQLLQPARFSCLRRRGGRGGRRRRWRGRKCGRSSLKSQTNKSRESNRSYLQNYKFKNRKKPVWNH